MNGRRASLPDGASLTALAALPRLGPAGLRRILAGTEPPDAWAAVLMGHSLDVDGQWATAARAIDVEERWRIGCRLGIRVHTPGDGTYPRILADTPSPPPVLFCLGDVSVVDEHARVGVVGTRACTRYGLGMAAQIGAELAGQGVAVVSGLALGIDGAAHEGAVAGRESGGDDAGPPVAVVAGGLDRPYPPSATRLWERVARLGVVMSESPVGTPIARWRFPNRNRLLAALSDVVVVVESHQHGGSLYTARAAMDRGVPVGAVPGSVRSPASAGTNDLLADGCFPVRDSTDVLVALELARAGDVPVRAHRRATRDPAATGTSGGASGAPSSSTAPPSAGLSSPAPSSVMGTGGAMPVVAARIAEAPPATETQLGEAIGAPSVRRGAGAALVLEAIGWERCSIEQILRRTGRSLSEVSLELERLAADGVIHGDGSSWERR
jgi:DNA processing protein